MNAEKTGALIKQLRTERNLTQLQLAELVFVSDKAVSKWERGEGCPDISIIPKLSEVFCIEIEDILEGKIPQKQDLSGMCIKDYNFYQPDRYPKSIQQRIFSMGEKIKQKMNKSFTALLNERCEFSVFGVDQMINIEFLRSLPKSCFFYDFNYSENGFCIEIDAELGKKLIRQDFNVYPEITFFDMDVFKNYFLKDIVSFLKDEILENTERKIPKSRFLLENAVSSSSANNALQDENLMMLLLTMYCRVNDTEGYLNIQLSEGFLQELSENGFFRQGLSDGFEYQVLSDIKARHNQENVFVEFGRFCAENVNLECGKIFILDKKETEDLNVVYRNKVIHTGKAIVADETMGVRILENHLQKEIVYDEDDYISVVLGFSYLADEEIKNLKEGSYILLKQLAGSSCLVYRGKKLIAEGEISIIYQNFAVKIISMK